MIDAYEAFALIGRFVSNLFEAWCLGFSAPPGMDGYSSVVFMASRVLFFPMAFFIIIAIVIGGATLVMEKINASKKRTEAEKQKAWDRVISVAVIAFILLLPLVYIVLPISIGYSRSETACADAYSYGAPASSVYKGGYTRFSFFPSKDGVGMCLAFPSDGEWAPVDISANTVDARTNFINEQSKKARKEATEQASFEYEKKNAQIDSHLDSLGAEYATK